MEKKLYRVRDGKVFMGLCSGIARYFDLDPTIVRVIWIVLSLACGFGLLAYLICSLFVPEEPDV